MSLAVVYSRGLNGIDAPEVQVEVHLANGLPAFNLVGLPEAEVRESRDRVRAAIITSQFEFPQRRITVNLAPADLPKEGGRFDLPIALGILAASQQIDADKLAEIEFCGELSLNGGLRGVRGVLAHALAASRSERALLVPEDNAEEAALATHLTLFSAQSLLQVCQHLNNQTLLSPHIFSMQHADGASLLDLVDVKGQLFSKRALEVAAAGGHSLLMFGPPGTGKSMLAQRLAGIMPAMSDEEALEVASLQSLGGQFSVSDWKKRPFRAPHHSASAAAIVGGGANPKPGEISLSHRGVLFLDEFPEYDRKVLESLREPLERGEITLSRAKNRVTYPAAFQLIAAMNPCPCGFMGAPGGRCVCTPEKVRRYQQKISGPLLDRIDIVIEVPLLSPDELQSSAEGEDSFTVRQRVCAARQQQERRQKVANSALSHRDIDHHCALLPAGQNLLKKAVERLNLSARTYHRILKVARTIADLAAAEQIETPHLAEAIQYRRNL